MDTAKTPGRYALRTEQPQRLRRPARTQASGFESGTAPAVPFPAAEHLFHHAPSAMCLIAASSAPGGVVVRANNALCHLAGRDCDDVVGRRFTDLVHPRDRAKVEQWLERLTLQASVLPEEPVSQVEADFLVTDETTWSARCRAIRLPGRGPVALLVDVEDFTGQQEELDRLRLAALHDPLTGLPNRVLLADRLQHALDAGRRTDRGVSVFYLDLNGFKSINDTLGHACGDIVLREVADRLRATVRAGDTVGRMGGDEFVVISPSLPAELVDVVRQRIESAITAGIQLPRGGVLEPGVSIGAVTSRTGDSGAELLESADADMYSRKVLKRGGHLRTAPASLG